MIFLIFPLTGCATRHDAPRHLSKRSPVSSVLRNIVFAKHPSPFPSLSPSFFATANSALHHRRHPHAHRSLHKGRCPCPRLQQTHAYHLRPPHVCTSLPNAPMEYSLPAQIYFPLDVARASCSPLIPPVCMCAPRKPLLTLRNPSNAVLNTFCRL